MAVLAASVAAVAVPISAVTAVATVEGTHVFNKYD